MTACEWTERCRSALGPVLDEPILEACLFGRAGSLVGAPGPLGDGIASLVSRRRAGGLPELFALVLSPSRLLAYAVSGADATVDPGGELAVWDPRLLSVRETRRDGVVTVFLTAGEQQIAMQAPCGERTSAFIRTLAILGR